MLHFYKRLAILVITSMGMQYSALAQKQPQQAEVFVQLGHRSSVTSVAISARGDRVVSGSLDGLVKYWDPSTGGELKTLEGHQGSVHGVAISPDGKTLASVGRDRTLRLWNASNGANLKTIAAHENIVLAVAYSVDGKHVISGSFDKSVKWWDPQTGKENGALESQSAPIRSLALSRRGDLLAVGAEDGTTRVYRFPSASRVAVLSGPKLAVLGLAFSPDGQMLASTAQDGSLRLWGIANQKEQFALNAHRGAATGVSFSENGRWLATAGQDTLVKLWNPLNGDAGPVLRGHSGEVQALAFAASASLLASASQDRSLRVWAVDATRAEESQVLRSRAVEVRATAISPVGAALATGGNDGQVRVWDTQSGKLLRAWVAHKGNVETLSFSPDGKLLVTGGQDRIARLWDWRRGTEVKTLTGHRGAVLSTQFSPDGRSLATGSFDASIRLWDVTSGDVRRELNGHKASVRGLAFSPDGNTLASAGFDDLLLLWDAVSGTLVKTYNDHANHVMSVAFSPDGQQLISSGEDSTVRIREMVRIGPAKVLTLHSAPVRSVSAGKSGVGSSVSVDGTFALWDYSKGEKILSRALGIGQLWSASMSANLLAIGGDAGATILLSPVDGKEKLRLFAFGDGQWVSITPEGYFLTSEGGAKYLSVRIGDDVHALDQFLESFYSPERVRQALGSTNPLASSSIEATAGVDKPSSSVTPGSARPGTGRPTTVQALGQVMPAPQVALVDVPSQVNTDELMIKLSISDSGGGVGDVRLYLNGTAVVVEGTRNLSIHAASASPSSATVAGLSPPSERIFRLKLVNGRNTIRAVAFNSDNSMQSAVAIQEIEARFVREKKIAVHALIIGIERFSNSNLNLQFSVSDARLFGDVIKERTLGLFDSTNVRMLLTPEETSREGIIRALKDMQSRVNPEDLFVFYVASHGTVDEGEYFLITSNVGATSINRLRQDAMPQNLLKELLGNVPTTKKLIVLDTCNAGQMVTAVQSGFGTRGLAEDRATKILSRAVGSTVLSAATSQQEALEGYNGHGLFTWVVSEGLRGKADLDKDGYVKTTEIADYVDNIVPELAEKVFNHRQFPVTSPTGQQFPLVKVN